MTLAPLSTWQKPDCINQSAGYRCGNDATQEVVFTDGNVRTAIRCCDDPKCVARATGLAELSHKAMLAAVGP